MNGLQYPFTPRERDLLGALARGLTVAEIMRELDLAEHTVNTYTKRLTETTGYRQRKLVVFAVHWAQAQGVK